MPFHADGDRLDSEWLTIVEPRLASELGDGESLLWMDKPKLGRVLAKSLQYSIGALPPTVGGTLLIVHAVQQWNGASTSNVARVGLLVFGILLLSFGIIHFGLLLRVWSAVKKVTYAVTDRRVIAVLPRLFGGPVASLCTISSGT